MSVTERHERHLVTRRSQDRLKEEPLQGHSTALPGLAIRVVLAWKLDRGEAMAERLRRLGRLGVFVAMAGASWLLEACSGSDDDDDSTGQGGSGGANVGTGGATTTGGTGGTQSGGEAGLHDLPCE